MMEQKNKTVFRSKIDWWMGCVCAFNLIVVWSVSLNTSLWFALTFGIGATLLTAVAFFGCWYEIADGQLIVYQFFIPHKYPIDKIKEVKKTIGYLATAGMSRERVSIKFTTPSVLKSHMPLEISPKDRDAFIAR